MLLSKYLNRYYVKYLLFYLFGIAATIVVDYCQLYIPEYLGAIVGLFADKETVVFDDIKSIIFNLIVVAFVLFLGRFLWRICIFNASHRIENNLRHDMFKKAERLSQRYYHENKVGSIMSWFTNDIECIEEYIGFGTIMIVDALFLSIIVIVKMIKLDLVLSIITIIPMILLIFWGALVEKFMSERWEARQKAFDDLYDFAQENFTGIRVIKSFVKETHELHAFAKIAKNNQDKNLEFAKLSVIFDVAIETIIAIIFSIVLGLGSYFVYCFATNNPIVLFGYIIELNAEKLTTFIGYTDALIWPMIAMGQIVSMRARSKASLERIESYMNQEEEIHNTLDPVILDNYQGGIEFKNFTFNYPGYDKHSLNDVSLNIKPGEMVGVVGKVGSGKTTLVNVLLRLYNLQENSVFIDGVDIMKLDINNLRDNIAYVPQDNFLFSDAIKNNIAFSNRKIEFDKIKEAARFADISDNIEGFAKGYETFTGERGVSLSGGQKQRISIARAYLKDAPIMIMDDSVSAVDVRTEETILKNIREKREGKTTIIIASRVSTVAHLDKIIVLKDGKLEGFGTPSELLESCETYKKMYMLQQLDNEAIGGK